MMISVCQMDVSKQRLLLCFFTEQQCFELDSQLQQLQDRSRREESLIQELTDGKAKVEADLVSSQDQLKHVGSKLAL